MKNFLLAINKTKGVTSFDVVNKVKKMLPKKTKVGHLGTLDPMATGLLIVAVNKATQLFDYSLAKTKTYEAVFEFGRETDTLDDFGQTIFKDEKNITLENINSVISKFIGKIHQFPPKYSAKHVNGVRAYELARQNIDFQLDSKEIEILNITAYETGEKNKFKMLIECGSGTYIRSIGRDIAYALDTYATMTELTRTKIDQFSLENAKMVDEINLETDKINISALIGKLEAITFSEEEKRKFMNGIKKCLDKQNGMYFKLLHENELFGIGQVVDRRLYLKVNLGD